MQLPIQLQNPQFRFTRVVKDTKQPFDKAWGKTGNFVFDAPEYLEHQGNTGILLGKKFGIISIDLDKKGNNPYFQETINLVESMLPKTFSYDTPSGGRQYLYFNDELEKIIDLKKEGKHCGELRGNGQSMIPPSSINGNAYKIFNDLPINKVSLEDIAHALPDYIKIEEEAPETNMKQDGERIQLDISKVVDLKQLTNYGGGKYRGEHPVHGSSTGQNFEIDTNKNYWFCFRDWVGGDALSLLAMVKGFVECVDAGKPLKGDLFKKVLRIAVDEYGAVVPDKILKREENREKIIDNLTRSLKDRTDVAQFTKLIVVEQGIFYDKNNLWWHWCPDNFCWKIVDEVDIMNAVDKSLAYGSGTLDSKMKYMILEGLRREGRKLNPKPLPLEAVQFKDKIVNISTQEIIPATKEYFAVNPIPFVIGDSDETPMIDKLFTDWVGAEKKELLYEMLAYSLSSEYFIHRIFCLIGAGSNGKSKFLNLMKKFVGDSNYCSTDLDALMASRFEAAKLHKKLLCLMGETNFSTISKTEKLKRLCGQDPVGFEYKGKNGFDDINYAKIVIATNSLPQTSDRTKGFYRRWLIIDFPNEFKENGDVLKTIPEIEYSNLARKTIKYLARLVRDNKFSYEGSVEDRQKDYEKHSNPMKQFIEEHFHKNPNGQVPFFEFFDEFSTYLVSKGLRNMSKREVSDQLENLGYGTEKKHPPHNQNATWVFILGLARGVVEASPPPHTSDTKDTKDTPIPVSSTTCSRRNEVAVSSVSSVSFHPIDGVLKRGFCSHCGMEKELVASDGVQRICEGCFWSSESS
jgi:P4 family phage/plasmid primase-like protien